MKKRIIAPAVALASIVMALVSCSPSTPSESSGTVGSSDSGTTPITSSSSSEPDASTLPVATGAHQYVDATYEERAKILGKLEKSLIDNNMAGLPLYSDSAYQLFNPRVQRGTNSYINGYGFSTLRDGKLTANLEGESEAKYQNYYHTWTSSDPQTLNMWNAKGSDVTSLASYCSTGLFGTRLNADKTGYEWYGVLAKDDHMIPVGDDGKVITKNPDSGELHTTWRVHVRTGEAGGVKYRTASTKTGRAKYDGTYVKLEDYLTPFKMLLNGANGLYRGNEMASDTGKGAISGASYYFNSTKGESKGVLEDTDTLKFSETVGVSVGTDEDGDYLQVKFTTPLNRFYAMYNIADSLYEPLPASFVNEVGIDALFGNSSDGSYSIVDNTLCLGPYLLESWEKEVLITFKKDDTWFESVADKNIYQIGGVHMKILTAYNQNKNVAIQEFLRMNNLDAVGIPSDYLADYSTDKRAVEIPGTSSWGLNINSCTKEYWEQLFGENGSVCQTAKADYWDVKPWMSNDNFIRGLFYSIDRANFASKMGGTPCIDVLGDEYISNPEIGEVYNDTDAHKAALADFWGDTVNTNGYSLALSEACFKEAINELLASGDIASDTTSISITIDWMYEYMADEEGALIGGYMKNAFDAAAKELNLPVRLEVNNTFGGQYYMDVYYDMMEGQFDLGFGSISGSALDPISYLEVYKSDNSSGFTLNWGKDTSEVVAGDAALGYDGMRWSFDALLGAANTGIVLDDKGQEINPVEITVSSITATATEVSIAGRIEVKDYDGLTIDLLAIFGETESETDDYFEVYSDCTWDGYMKGVNNVVWDKDDDGKGVTFSFDLTDGVAANVISYKGLNRFGVDYDITIDGVYGGLKSSYGTAKLSAAAPSGDSGSSDSGAAA